MATPAQGPKDATPMTRAHNRSVLDALPFGDTQDFEDARRGFLGTARQRWEPLAPDVTGFMTDLPIPQWNLQLRVMLYRKHVQHETPKNFQLDLFTPDDGHFEYYAVATNMPLHLPALYAFVCGRGAQEKTFGELKGEFALDVVPTRHYGANSAWQQLSILAHNVARSFQLDTLAEPKPRSRKRTYA